MITLKNLSKRTVIFNLPHAVACSETVCTCSRMKVGVVDHDKATGDRKVRAVNQRIGASVTLLPRGTKGDPKLDDDGKIVEPGPALDQVSGLLNEVAQVPEVKQALARREIEIIRETAAPEAPEPEPAPAPTKKKPEPAPIATAPAASAPSASKES